MLSELAVRYFDFLKKRNMERQYLDTRIWGRKEQNPDVTAGVALLSDRQYGRCLDVGAGLGHYASELAPRCSAIVALDISKRAIERAKARLVGVPNVDFRVGNIRDVHADEHFDLILLADVLYYLGDLHFPAQFQKLVERIVALVSPGGRIFISTFITRGRTEQEARAYAPLFVGAGMRVTHEDVFVSNGRSWLFTVLAKD